MKKGKINNKNHESQGKTSVELSETESFREHKKGERLLNTVKNAKGMVNLMKGEMVNKMKIAKGEVADTMKIAKGGVVDTMKIAKDGMVDTMKSAKRILSKSSTKNHKLLLTPLIAVKYQKYCCCKFIH